MTRARTMTTRTGRTPGETLHRTGNRCATLRPVDASLTAAEGMGA
ncbi:hypothetical protein [Streptomyces hesseae]|uniref:Uncharacterized protein n=1 Tax=Streptomyces hesseae TaxID=3075519 RepID=A0ABU2SN31_9ACTN|nr:hypothetical protein [Streptomyces sp. DSM 40473]MDT0449190.1 hypothetical protein [Streptomyces sp. DSM 40473]